MPRYFFNARKPGRLMPDAEGEELPDLQAARRMAADVAAELTRNAAPGAWREWSFEIADESGEIVLTLPFPDIARTD